MKANLLRNTRNISSAINLKQLVQTLIPIRMKYRLGGFVILYADFVIFVDSILFRVKLANPIKRGI